MKVVKVDEIEDKVEFDNGIIMYSDFEPDCCETNYIDFSQLKVNDEFEGDEIIDLIKVMDIKSDGVIIRDINSIPKWLQARSIQNGYYSTGVFLNICYKESENYFDKGEVFRVFICNGKIDEDEGYYDEDEDDYDEDEDDYDEDDYDE